MSEETAQLIVVTIIASIPPTMAAIAALVVALRGSAKLTELHLQINSRMDELLKVSTSAARAEGVESERAATEAKIGDKT